MRQLIYTEKKRQFVKLHDCTFDMLFKHKNEIFRRLSDIRGIYSIDHAAIHIVNPDHEESIFSITPSVEYNLIAHNLWKFDGSFVPFSHADGTFSWWDKAYKSEAARELKNIKELKHNFSLGFNLFRRVGKFYLVYSFASRGSKIDLKEYYLGMINELFSLGEYGYKLIRDIYAQYCDAHVPPYTETEQPSHHQGIQHLKLIVNNR